MGWIRFLFRWDGRIRGGQFLVGLFGASLLTAPVAATVVLLFAPRDPISGGWSADSYFWALWSVGQSPAFVAIASLAARRLHDLGLSARWILPMLAYNLGALLASQRWDTTNTSLGFVLALPPLFVVAWLVAASGSPTPNAYGPAQNT